MQLFVPDSALNDSRKMRLWALIITLDCSSLTLMDAPSNLFCGQTIRVDLERQAERRNFKLLHCELFAYLLRGHYYKFFTIPAQPKIVDAEIRVFRICIDHKLRNCRPSAEGNVTTAIEWWANKISHRFTIQLKCQSVQSLLSCSGSSIPFHRKMVFTVSTRRQLKWVFFLIWSSICKHKSHSNYTKVKFKHVISYVISVWLSDEVIRLMLLLHRKNHATARQKHQRVAAQHLSLRASVTNDVSKLCYTSVLIFVDLGIKSWWNLQLLFWCLRFCHNGCCLLHK